MNERVDEIMWTERVSVKCSHQGPGAARGVTRRVVVDRRPNGAIARETAPVFARGVYIVVIE